MKNLNIVLILFLLIAVKPCFGQNNDDPTLDETMGYLVDKISHNCNTISYVYVYKSGTGWADKTRKYSIKEVSYKDCNLIISSNEITFAIPIKRLNIEQIRYLYGSLTVECESDDIAITGKDGYFDYETRIELNFGLRVNKAVEPPKIIKALKHACKLCGGRYDLFK